MKIPANAGEKIEESNKLRYQKIKIAQLTKRPVNEKEQQIQTPENEECKKQTNKDKWNSNKTSTSIILFCFSFYFRPASLNRQDSFPPQVNICLIKFLERVMVTFLDPRVNLHYEDICYNKT